MDYPCGQHGERLMALETQHKETNRRLEAIEGKMDTFNTTVTGVQTAITEMRTSLKTSFKTIGTVWAVVLVIIDIALKLLHI